MHPQIMEDRRGMLTQFNTLKRLLKGEALEKVSVVDVSEDDPVGKIFEILDKYYDCPPVVMEIVVGKVEALSTLSQNDAGAIDNFVNIVQKAVSTYKVHGEQLENQYWFYNKVFKKLPFPLQAEFVKKVPKDERKLGRLLVFLREREKIIRETGQTEKSKVSSDSKTTSNMAVVDKKAKPQSFISMEMGGTKQSSKLLSKKGKSKPGACAICNKPGHDAEVCRDLLKLPPNARVCKAYDLFICFKCLKKGHSSSKCTAVPSDFKCPIEDCEKRHHEVFHGSGNVHNVLQKYRKGRKVYGQSTDKPVSKREGKGEEVKDEPSTSVRSNLTVSPIATPEPPPMETEDHGNHHLRLLRVLIKAPGRSKVIPVAALIDNGCNKTMIDEALARELELPGALTPVDLQGIHGSKQEMMAYVDFEVSR